MKSLVFYLGVALLFTHEMDAMQNHEWRVLPLTSFLDDPTGRVVFLLAHIPIFAFVIGFLGSLNLKTRHRARAITSGFLAVHAVLHLAFSQHSDYEFSNSLSSILIYGAALCGIAYFTLDYFEGKGTDV